jgi:hypothetical protein
VEAIEGLEDFELIPPLNIPLSGNTIGTYCIMSLENPRDFVFCKEVEHNWELGIMLA